MKKIRLSVMVFWCSALLALVCVNSIGAVLYAGVPMMDDGSGFISLSPLADCIVWGGVLILCLPGILVPLVLRRVEMPRIPGGLRYPAAYLAALAALSVLVVLLGLTQVLDRHSPVHLPFWGYVGLLAVLYPVCGFCGGRLLGGKLRWALIWGVGIAVLFVVLGAVCVGQADARDAALMVQYPNLIVGYTANLMDSSIGAFLGRLNLPASVLMGNYDYAYYDNLGGVHHFPREAMMYAVCLLPPLLFFCGWLAGHAVRQRCADR